jgi:phosphonate transport system permease protein
LPVTTALATARRRDPLARRRATATLIAFVVLWQMLVLAEFKPAALFEPGNLQVMRGFLAAFLPPSTSAEFLGMLLRATLQTLAIATAGIALSFVIAVPLALAVTHALSVSRIGPGRGRWWGEGIRVVVRIVLAVLRAIPEVVWALVFVRALGLGAGAGVLALAITYGGMLGKVYAEILESADAAPTEALLRNGAGRLQAFLFGALPQCADECVSYTVYRWECAIRSSVVLGFVGAGGLGQLLDSAAKLFAGGEVASILLVFIALVAASDRVSVWLRRAIA